ncbi:MAG: hydrogenase maturation protease [Anaerolineae bacterium]
MPSPARIAKVQQLTALEKLFTIELPWGQSLGHEPGQFVEVSILGIGEAPISISSSPSRSNGTFELCVRRVGDVTSAMHKLDVGATIGVRGPFGHGFPIDKMRGKDILFAPGGLGLAPVRSLINQVLDERGSFGRVIIRAIIVDAAEMGQPPGTIVRFRPDEVTLTGSAGPLSLHRTAVADALALAEALGEPMPEMVFYGMQPGRIGWGETLSPEVAAAVPQLVQAILREVSQARGEETDMPKTENRSQVKGLILIVDDDPDMVEALRMPLEAHGYSVAHAASGRVALNMIPELRPDLIILDVMMETTTEGFQLSLALRSPDPRSPYAAYRDIPILMLTSIHATTPLRFSPDQDYLLVDVFIDKPVDPDKLIAKIAELLAKK